MSGNDGMSAFSAYWQSGALQMSHSDIQDFGACAVIDRKVNVYLRDGDISHDSRARDIKYPFVALDSIVIGKRRRKFRKFTVIALRPLE